MTCCKLNRLLSLLALVTLLWGCGDSTGPGTGLAGTWRFNFTDLTGHLFNVHLACRDLSLNFSIAAPDSFFTGTQTGSAVLTCTAGTAALERPISSNTIYDGHLSGSTVTFRFMPAINAYDSGIYGTQFGTRHGNTIAGTAGLTLTNGSPQIDVNGKFTARKLRDASP